MRTNQKRVSKALGELSRIAKGSSTPILNSVEIVSGFGAISLRATDLHQELTFNLSAEDTGSISACVDASTLYKATRGEGLDVDICDGEKEFYADLRWDGVAMSLPSMPRDAMPEQVKKDALYCEGRVDCDVLIKPLEYALAASSTDAGRPHLNAMLFTKTEIISTDGHRLHKAPSPFTLDREYLISRETCVTLRRLLKTCFSKGEVVQISLNGDRVWFKSRYWELTARLVDARFPPYEKAIPSTFESFIQCETKDLGKALKKLQSVFSKDTPIRIGNTFNGLEITVSDPDKGNVSVKVSCTGEINFPDNETVVSCSARYLAESIDRPGSVRLAFNGQTDAIGVHLDDGYFAVVMPCRI